MVRLPSISLEPAELYLQSQTSYGRESCTGSYFECQEKAENISEREGGGGWGLRISCSKQAQAKLVRDNHRVLSDRSRLSKIGSIPCQCAELRNTVSLLLIIIGKCRQNSLHFTHL